jgi:hypothetical protein
MNSALCSPTTSIMMHGRMRPHVVCHLTQPCCRYSSHSCGAGHLHFPLLASMVAKKGLRSVILISTYVAAAKNAKMQLVVDGYCDLHNNRPKTAETSAIRVS